VTEKPKRLLVLAEPERLFLPNAVAHLAQRHPLLAVVEVPGPKPKVVLERAWAAFGGRGVAALAVAEGLASLVDKLSADRYYSLRKVADRLAVPYHRVPDLHGPECRELITAYAPDVVFAQVSKLVRPELLELATFWNKHCSLLPQYGGVLPVFWGLLAGEKRLGVTVHEMDAGFDTGPVLQQRAVSDFERSFFGAYHRLYDEVAPLLDLALRQDRTAEANPETETSYRSFPTRADRRAFRRAGNRLGRPFRLHPRVSLARAAPQTGVSTPADAASGL
jgi:hypothetical protein